MSGRATIWASRQHPPRPADKLVLWAMADAARDGLLCFAAVATLVEFTGLDRKTVLSSLHRLKSEQLIVDTGERRGETRQIIVWRLPVPANDGEAETEPETEPSQKRNRPKKGGKASQKRDTEPPHEPIPSDAIASSGRTAAVRGTRLDYDWQPTKDLPDAVQKVVDGWPPGRLQQRLDEFRDFWISRAGKDATKADWDRTWWNRIRAIDEMDKREERRGTRNRNTDRPSAWAPRPGMDGREPISLDD
ncbi:MAG: helix-turn-helix domain-containing protein [Rhizorhabdus sp.]|uniref:helix-turn-helix domain-containing protein n=1 Tax=Rhizorhabdus sp. TaxID=1968843 RepID=UPI001B4E584B|nr:helix-turn-helix domain-containing protein [Rhizorhabdus sp.]MBP8233111.1 helix-turn-helix domain-containing protein [Rhizorhabdus sp.]